MGIRVPALWIRRMGLETIVFCTWPSLDFAKSHPHCDAHMSLAHKFNKNTMKSYTDNTETNPFIHISFTCSHFPIIGYNRRNYKYKGKSTLQ